jgi:YesN/AraC family two-component response regulator
MVQSELEKLGIAYKTVESGEVQLEDPLSETNWQMLKTELHTSELEVMNDKKAMLIHKIMNIIVETVHYCDDFTLVNFLTFWSEKLHQDYHKIAAVFSKTKGITIEHYILLHKVERMKELIIYDEPRRTEIPYKPHYSSIAHIFRQFKQLTGLTPTFKIFIKK